MTRRITGLCVASVCSCVISLGAQGTTASPTTQRSGAMAGHDVTVTGCVSKAADGKYMLTNAMVEPAGTTTTGGTGSTAGATTGGTTAGSTAGGTGSTAGATTTGSMASNSSMSWMLSGGTDLDKHLGHKVQVMGNTTWDPMMNRPSTAGATTGTSGSTAGTAAAGATTAGTTSGSMSNMANRPSLDVRSLKMVSASCP